MKKYKIYLLIFSVFILLVQIGCKKYPDGPLISLHSKTARVANTWRYDKVLINGIEQDLSSAADTDGSYLGPPYDMQIIELTKDGKVKWSFTNIPGIVPATWTYSGVWKFNDDKSSLLFQLETQTFWTERKILKLKNKELWFQETIQNHLMESHLVPK